jgi:hypothetical protein
MRAERSGVGPAWLRLVEPYPRLADKVPRRFVEKCTGAPVSDLLCGRSEVGSGRPGFGSWSRTPGWPTKCRDDSWKSVPGHRWLDFVQAERSGVGRGWTWPEEPYPRSGDKVPRLAQKMKKKISDGHARPALPGSRLGTVPGRTLCVFGAGDW